MPTVYIDDRGWIYKVMPGIGHDAYKARYQKPHTQSWKGVRTLPWRKTFEEAQQDLDALAAKKRWQKYQGKKRV